MLQYPNINPVAFSIGPFSIRWYGLTYLIGFIGCYWLSVVRGRSRGWTSQQLADVLFYVALGIIFGGRIGYILFYHPSEIFTDPITLLKFWEPGRSFHGGMLGVFFALLIYVRFDIKKFVKLTDFIAPAVPIGLGAGRIGNFLNGELYGRITTMPWGMVFPHAGSLPRHPSQLYEFFLEGVVLCLLLLWYARKPRPLGAVSGLFLIAYGAMRCLVEFVRAPDDGHGFVAFDWLTMGQLLSIPMIIFGIFLMLYKKEAKH
jgi:phosphatidylglycerol:prolipoprotein diacylglycerol transferase